MEKEFKDWWLSWELPKNSLRNIYGIGYSYEQIFNENGIKTIEKLIKSNYKKIPLNNGRFLSEEKFNKFKLHAKSYKNKKVYFVNNGWDILPSKKIIYFDIETDLACEKIWLIGILKDGKFIRLYADRWSQEKRILKEFLNILKESKGYYLFSYSSTSFDFRVTKNALIRRKIDFEELEKFEHYDICTWIRKSFIFPKQSYALKVIGNYLKYPFKNKDMCGFDVAVAYEDHLKTKKKLPKKIFEYNKDDVYSIPYIVNKLNNRRLKWQNHKL